MMNGTFKTTVIWHDRRGSECEAEVRVTYVGRKGYPETRIDPAEPATVEITDITPVTPGTYLREGLTEDDELIAECFEHSEATAEAAEDARADDRRDRLMEERNHG